MTTPPFEPNNTPPSPNGPGQYPTPPQVHNPYGQGFTPNPYENQNDLDGTTDPNNLSLPLYGATFSQAVRRFFKKYAIFYGRASRSEFWWACLFNAIVGFVLYIPIIIGVILLGSATQQDTVCDTLGNCNVITVPVQGAGHAAGMVFLLIGGALSFLYGLAIIVPSLAIAWRRLHDANLPGPLWFISLTGIGSYVLIVLYILKSNPAGKRFDR